MRVIEYGRENDRVAMLLHGGGLGPWSFRAVAELLQDDFHVIVPLLDGHAESDDVFCSIEKNAESLIEYIDVNCGGRVDFIGGLSLGGQVLLEMLATKPDICGAAIIESSSVIPSKITSALMKPTMDMSYWLIAKRWFAKWQFEYLKIRGDLFEEYFEDTKKITKENMTAFLAASTAYEIKESISKSNAKVIVAVGEKEMRSMQLSSKKIHGAVHDSELVVKNGLCHGEWSINHPEDYASCVAEMTTKDYHSLQKMLI